MSEDTPKDVVGEALKRAFDNASDDDIKKVVRNLARLLRTPEYEALDPDRGR